LIVLLISLSFTNRVRVKNGIAAGSPVFCSCANEAG
jgi:hypothetical protein